MDHATIEHRGDVAVVALDRAPANAMDPGLLGDLISAAEALAAEAPGAIVLTGRPGFFSAGADLKLVPTLDAAGQKAMVDGINRMCSAWYGLPHPVVCAVNGHAIAGGLVLALCGDYRVAATEGRYGLTELRADLVDAADLRELGAFDEVVPTDDVVDRALAVATDLASLPASAYAATKRRLRAEVLGQAARLEAGEVDPVGEAWTDADTGTRAAAILRGG